MLKSLVLFAFAGLLFTACSKEEISTYGTAGSDLSERAGNPVIHHISVGGNDICAALGYPAGCDKNFSLTAVIRADESVSGQWTDGNTNEGTKGVHVDITCANLIGNSAVIYGVVKSGTRNGEDVTGRYAMTAVVDNGTSSKDPLDQISYSFLYRTPRDCNNYTAEDFPLEDLEIGQVKIK
ncbi:MAG: hypothetical protein KDC49_13155 [Saprospiraceae bacterium]|nr:hypothetical protein [Saprospiraceae bacterium]